MGGLGELSGAPGAAAELVEDVPGLEPTPLSVALAAGNRYQAALRASPARLPGPGKTGQNRRERDAVRYCGLKPRDSRDNNPQGFEIGCLAGDYAWRWLVWPRGDATPGHPALEKLTGIGS